MRSGELSTFSPHCFGCFPNGNRDSERPKVNSWELHCILASVIYNVVYITDVIIIVEMITTILYLRPFSTLR